jgi:hypothetical protein
MTIKPLSAFKYYFFIPAFNIFIGRLNMRKILILLFTFGSFTGLTQRPIITNNPSTANNHYYFDADLPVLVDKYPKFADGNPYFLEEWVNGDIVLGNGKIYHNVKLRLDLVENTLQYISPSGVELIATTPIKSIILKDSIQGNKYIAHSAFLEGAKNIEPGWYQVLVTGAATLYKHIVKTIATPKNYSSSMTEASVNTSEEYFVHVDSTLSRVKKIKELPGLLKNKTDELEKYMNNKKLSGRSDSIYIDLVRYYNSLAIK